MRKEYNLLPGPSGLIDKFTKFLIKNPVSQRSDEFLSCWFNVKTNLKILADNPYGEIAVLTSSATGAMEASILSLCDGKSKVLVISAGKFGDRFYEILNCFSINSNKLSFLEDRKIDYNIIEKELKKGNFTHITYQICETSTGIFCNPKIIGLLAKKYGCMTIADGVSAFLSDYIYQKEDNIDALILGSQKGFNSPAGISFVSLSPKAIKKIDKSDIKSYYFDLKKYLDQPPYTPAINTIFYMEEIIKEINKIGYNIIIEKNTALAKNFRENVKKYGLTEFPNDPSNGVSVIEFEDSENFIDFCENRFHLYIGHGQGSLKGKIFRVGHFGLTSLKNYDMFNLALKEFIQKKRTNRICFNKNTKE